MDSPEHDPAETDAEEAFAEFLFLEEAGESVDFEAFCAGFDGDRKALRSLHRSWRGLAPILDEGRPESTSADAYAALRDTLRERDAVFERYELKEELARGGMGTVMRVWDRDLERHLAMKVVLPTGLRETPVSPGSASPNLGRFLEEAKVTGQLDHPGIVPVHELGVDESGRCYFTMKLVRGRDFKEIIDAVHRGEEGWTLPRALQVILKVCEALAYAHSKGVIHRDLKPSNVMVGRFGEAYLMDWGLARVRSRPDAADIRLRVELDRSDEIQSVRHPESGDDSAVITMDGHVVGTPAYIPPEQVAGQVERIGPRSDIYSLGATLYHLLTGAMPYIPKGGHLPAQTVLAMVLQGPPKPVHELANDVPLELAAICDRAMAREIDDRYTDLGELAEDLQAFLEGRTVRAFRGGAAWEFKKWVARNKALAGTSLAVILLALSTSIVWGFYLSARNRTLATGREEAVNEQQVAVAEREQLDEESRELLRTLRVSDQMLLEQLESAADRLPPALPANLEAHQLWLRDARTLNTNHALHRSRLEEERAAGIEAWELRSLELLIHALDRFTAEPDGALPRVEARARFAEEVTERTLSGIAATTLWAEALAAIRDESRTPRYEGLVLPPQLGLLPLGPDPDSGLWEFAALATGEAPAREEGTGRLEVGDQTALILVLVPGGTFEQGAQPEDPTAANWDPDAQNSEAPVHQVALEPFFVAKHELTRAQWRRATGQAPSLGEGARLPVAGVSWTECLHVLAGLDLELPTESQWEFAARGGEASPWWWGFEAGNYFGRAHLGAPGADPTRPVRVTELAGNGFGLHHVLGNVAEWCADSPGPYDSRARDEGRRVFRGGSYQDLPKNARLADRYANRIDDGRPTLGLRPVRRVDW